MKVFIRTPILFVCLMMLFLGSCTKIKSRSDQKTDEDSVTGDNDNTNVTPWDTADSAERSDSSKDEADFVNDDSENENTSDSGEDHDDSATSSKQTSSDNGDGENQCDSDEILCDDSCVPNDEKNCGECDHNCIALAHVTDTVGCEEGKCVLTSSSCDSGWSDCNDDSEDGCETNITETKNCGGCENDCSDTAKPLCAPIEGDDGYECAADCPSDAPTLCDDSCVNTDNSPLHCGECNKECESFPNSKPICEDAKCSLECKDDNHLKCSDGCFPNDDKNCGTCGKNCTESGKVCDGNGNCIECIVDNDCKSGNTKYCVDSKCTACRPGDSSTCEQPSNDCMEILCSSTGTCRSQTQKTEGTRCRGGRCVKGTCEECITGFDCIMSTGHCYNYQCTECDDYGGCRDTECETFTCRSGKCIPDPKAAGITCGNYSKCDGRGNCTSAVYNRCSPPDNGSPCTDINGNAGYACDERGYCVPMCLGGVADCPSIPGVELQCAYGCRMLCRNNGCPPDMKCVDQMCTFRY